MRGSAACAVARAVQLGLSGETLESTEFCAELARAARTCDPELADEIFYLPRVLNWDAERALQTLRRIATETGILHQMQKASPGKTFIPAPPEGACNCNDCPYMKKNTLEKLHDCLLNLEPEIVIPEPIRARAEVPIRRMLELSA